MNLSHPNIFFHSSSHSNILFHGLTKNGYLKNCMEFISKQTNRFIWPDSRCTRSSCSNYKDEYHFSDENYTMVCNSIIEKY